LVATADANKVDLELNEGGVFGSIFSDDTTDGFLLDLICDKEEASRLDGRVDAKIKTNKRQTFRQEDPLCSCSRGFNPFIFPLEDDCFPICGLLSSQLSIITISSNCSVMQFEVIPINFLLG